MQQRSSRWVRIGSFLAFGFAAASFAQDFDACLDQCYVTEEACIEAACADETSAEGNCDAACISQTATCVASCGPDPNEGDAAPIDEDGGFDGYDTP